MEIERAIIEALKEERRYNDLFLITSSIRRKKDFGLSKQDFSIALKRLIESKVVLPPEKRYGKYSLNLDAKGQLYKKFLIYEDKPNQFLNFLESQNKAIEETIQYFKENKIPSQEKYIAKMQEHITNTIRVLLYHQLKASLLVDTSWSIPIAEREFISQEKKGKKLIKKLSYLTENLNKRGSGITIMTLFYEIQKELDNASKEFDKSTKYFKKKIGG